ncbi:hypothetical protein KIPB_011511, partial [Kipferlia bialata]|eukprot:g11511.t1
MDDTSDVVGLDVLNAENVQELQRRTGYDLEQVKATVRNVQGLNKRFVIVSYTSDFDRVHYPLSLNHMRVPDAAWLFAAYRRVRSALSSAESRSADAAAEVRAVTERLGARETELARLQ